MAIIDEKKARDEVSKGNARCFYYLAGEEAYKIIRNDFDHFDNQIR